MHVLTLDRHEFEKGCAELAELVFSGGFSPDLIVGIASGGAIVAAAVAGEAFFRSATLCEMSCRRNSTPLKKKFGINAIVKKLPRRLSDALRALEHHVAGISHIRNRRRVVSYGPACEPLIARSQRILVVDDAVDSGATMSAVIERIREINGIAEIRSAAITVTTNMPIVQPDYCLHRGILVRFPWSADAV